MNTQKILIGATVVLSLVVVGLSFRPINVNINSGESTRPGAVPTLDGVDNPYTTIGGQKTAFVGKTLIATSSSVCVIKNPYATTTLVMEFGMDIATNGIGTINGYLSTTSVAGGFGSSTPAIVGPYSVVGGSLVYWTPSSSTSSPALLPGINNLTGQSNFVLQPNESLTFRLATSTPGIYTTYLVGSCSATFKSF